MAIINILYIRFFIHSGVKDHQKKKELKQKKEQEEKQLKEEEDRKIQLIKTLTPSQKQILMQYDYNNQIQQLTQNWEVTDMIEKKILKLVGAIKPIGRMAKTMYPVSIKIEYWALEIITKYPEILN